MKFPVIFFQTVNCLCRHEEICFWRSVGSFKQRRVCEVDTELQIGSHVHDSVIVDLVIPYDFVKADTENWHTGHFKLDLVRNDFVTASLPHGNLSVASQFIIRNDRNRFSRDCPLGSDIRKNTVSFVISYVVTVKSACL